MNRLLVGVVAFASLGIATPSSTPPAHAHSAIATRARTITCPLALAPTAGAPEGVLAAVRTAVPKRYPHRILKNYQVVLLMSLAGKNYLTLDKSDRLLRQIAVAQ